MVKQKKIQWSSPECLLKENRRENRKLNVVLVLVLHSKALYCPPKPWPQLLDCKWRHGGHVIGQEQKKFLTLFSCKFFGKKFFCIDPQHGRLVTWLQTKNSLCLLSGAEYRNGLHRWKRRVHYICQIYKSFISFSFNLTTLSFYYKLARLFLVDLKGSRYHKSCSCFNSLNLFRSWNPDSVARICFKHEAAAVTTWTL